MAREAKAEGGAFRQASAPQCAGGIGHRHCCGPVASGIGTAAGRSRRASAPLRAPMSAHAACRLRVPARTRRVGAAYPVRGAAKRWRNAAKALRGARASRARRGMRRCIAGTSRDAAVHRGHVEGCGGASRVQRGMRRRGAVGRIASRRCRASRVASSPRSVSCMRDRARIRTKPESRCAVSVDTMHACADSVIRAHVVARDSRRSESAVKWTTMRTREGRSMDRRQDGIGARHVAPSPAVIGTPRLRCATATVGAATRHAVPAPRPRPAHRTRTAICRTLRATGSARYRHRTTGPAAVWAVRRPPSGCGARAYSTTERARSSCQ